METLERFAVLADQLHQEEPEVPVAPIPFYACSYRNVGYAICGPVGCGKPFTDLVSLRRHRAEYCKVLKGNI